MTKDETFQFESAYARVEKILEELNSGNVSLDRSLELYEEADELIARCNKRLNEAEQRIAILIKRRNGELVADEQGQPATQDWKASTSQTNPTE